MGIRRSAASPLAPALSRSVEFRPLPTPRTSLAQSALRPRYPKCAPIVLSSERGSRTMPSRPLPRDLNRALDRLNAEPERSWTLSSLAAACGVAPRTLQKHFRRFLGRTPHEFIRDLRLDRARQHLLREPTQARVTDVAARCGFNHLGRFAACYRKRYGESPSATLLRCRPALAGHASSLPILWSAVERPTIAMLPFPSIGTQARRVVGLADEIAMALLQL